MHTNLVCDKTVALLTVVSFPHSAGRSLENEAIYLLRDTSHMTLGYFYKICPPPPCLINRDIPSTYIYHPPIC